MASPNISSFTVICLIILISLFPWNCYSQGNGKIKGMFVFGSSLVDNGNNNFLDVKAKCNYLPYGIDFAKGPTGRFNNGKNVIDVLCDSLSLPYVPPFYDPSTNATNIINGVCYASGGSGILDSTGTVLGEVTGMNKQIRNFEITLSQLEAQLGQKREEFVQNYMIVVGVGGNDITMGFFSNKAHGSLEDFTTNLMLSLSVQLKKLYSLGGRKFVLMSANPLGCYPGNRNATNCSEEKNNGAIVFNSKLKSLVDTLQKEMPASHLVFVNSYQIIMDIINNPAPQGFEDVKNTCYVITAGKECGPISTANCKKEWTVCDNRKAFVFFDAIHPTEAVNLIIGSKAFSSNLQSDVYPINVQQLSML